MEVGNSLSLKEAAGKSGIKEKLESQSSFLVIFCRDSVNPTATAAGTEASNGPGLLKGGSPSMTFLSPSLRTLTTVITKQKQQQQQLKQANRCGRKVNEGDEKLREENFDEGNPKAQATGTTTATPAQTGRYFVEPGVNRGNRCEIITK